MRELIAALIALSFALPLSAADDQPVPFRGMTYPLTLQLDHNQKFGAVLNETPFSEPSAELYDTVFIQGELPDAGARLDLTLKAGSFLSSDVSYTYADMRLYPDGRFWAKYTIAAPTKARLKITARNQGVSRASAVTLYEVETADSRDTGEALVSTAAFTYVADPALSVPAAAPFRLIRRADWQAKPPKEPFSTHTPVGFVIHHTQGRYPQTPADALAEIRFVQDFHQNGRGWIDIGYHFLIDPAGNIYEGRPVGVIGAHVKNKNTGRTGISVMGNYHPPVSNKFTDASRDSFVAVGTWLRRTYGVQRADFTAHRDLQDTDCPGDDLYAKVPALRALIFDPVLNAPPPPALQPAATPEQGRALQQLLDQLR